MNLEFIGGGPALLVSNELRVLVIADLHLGIESDLARHGIYFQSRSRQRQEKALRCIREAGPDIILLLGDVKHSIPTTTMQEYRELPGMLSAFRKHGLLRVTPGNHDTGIERFLSPEEMLPRNGTLVDGCGYLHGHMYPDPSLAGHLLIAGHHHPFVCLQDEVGCSLRSPAYLFAMLRDECFVAGKHENIQPVGPAPDLFGSDGSGTGIASHGRNIRPSMRRGQPKPSGCTDPCPLTGGDLTESDPVGKSRVLFVPAFNELSGFDIQKIVASPISPLSRCMDKASCEIFLPDGTYIGPLSSVEEHDSTGA
ncbi:MAG TPA: metallophosphoesterase [Methanoregulaceae archaeon]|nr:metallophosphoesterase [Methanoregulaceae archaeon]